MNKVFLDYGSCAPVCKKIIDLLPNLADNFYNASSIYEFGLNNKKDIEKVREKIANLINADPKEIYFVSSASEGNSLCINGFIKRHGDYDVVCSSLEHTSIYNNRNIDYVIPSTSDGFIDLNYIVGFKRRTLFAIMHSCNEIGTIQPIKEAARIIHNQGGYILCDAASSFGKVNIDVKDLDVDFLTASGNKIGSLKGVGFVYIKDGIDISPIIVGEQENKLRGGTYNELSIKSFGIAIDELKSYNKVKEMRDYLYLRLKEIENVSFNSSIDCSLPNLINICIKDINIDSQQLVSLLDLSGFMVSPSSACHSGSSTPSHVLKAIGLSDYDANHSIRITLGHENTYDELDNFVECLKNIIELNKVF